MVLSTSTMDSPTRSGLFTEELALRSMTSWDAACRMLQCLSWIIPVLRRYILKEFLIQRRQAMMNSGDIPASSSRTQAQTLNKWAEYRESLAFDVLGWIALSASRKRLAMCLPCQVNKVFLVGVACHWHVVRLAQASCTEYHLSSGTNSTYFVTCFLS